MHFKFQGPLLQHRHPSGVVGDFSARGGIPLLSPQSWSCSLRGLPIFTKHPPVFCFSFGCLAFLASKPQGDSSRGKKNLKKQIKKF